ncbi:MAG: hypothetical protein BWX48_02829 [Verrucomicrobia bacterium ADurb.Bin006]|nr:MAG: hypothetical protein BWX48_02829 [Verrucomicrobia bacterium ADurb.Bin006]
MTERTRRIAIIDPCEPVKESPHRQFCSLKT